MFRKRPQIATGIGFSSYRGFPAKPAQAFQCVLGKQVVYHHHLRPRCPPAPANLFTVVAGIYRGRNQPLPACEMKSRQGASNAIVAGPIILLFPVVPHFVFGRRFIGENPRRHTAVQHGGGTAAWLPRPDRIRKEQDRDCSAPQHNSAIPTGLCQNKRPHPSSAPSRAGEGHG